MTRWSSRDARILRAGFEETDADNWGETEAGGERGYVGA
jgi:hypothetical protein